MACVQADGCIFKGRGARKLCDYVTGAQLVFCGLKSECQDFRVIFFFLGSKPKFGRGIKTCSMTKFILKKLSRACWRGEPLFREGADTSLFGPPCRRGYNCVSAKGR